MNSEEKELQQSKIKVTTQMCDSLEIIAPKGLIHYMDVVIRSCWERMYDDEFGALKSLLDSCKYCIETAEKKKWVKQKD